MMSEDKSKQTEAELEQELDQSASNDVEPETVIEDQAVDADAESKEVSVDEQLAAALTEVGKLKDAYLRAKAEEDNVRRRSEKEVANSRKFAVEGFAKEMMSVRDSLQLACNVDLPEDSDESLKSIHQGVEVTLKQLDSAFTRFSLTEINPEPGTKLDPNLHQAMSMIESEDVAAGCIINVIQVGFQLHDRLLRAAMVVVAK